ncbi:MAG: cytochrome P450 [Firmicutes bacterium]|nr:cytochrome P450 [Bacillota bacterium]
MDSNNASPGMEPASQNARLSLRDQLMRRVIEPAALRYFQWRGDPVAKLLQRATKADPYPLYAHVRRLGLVRSPLGPWMTATYSTAASVLRDPRFSSSPVHQHGYRPPTYPEDDPRGSLPSADLLTMDPPDHTRLRRLVSRAFTPKAIADLDPWIREVTDQLLSTVDGRRGFDLIEAVAFPLPIAVICHLLGIPVEDQEKFRVWGHDVASTLDPQSVQSGESRSRASELALTRYLHELVRKRRAYPDQSLLSHLIAAEEEGDRLTTDELVSMALLLLIAGFETTSNLIGNGTVAMLGDREQWGRLREDPAIIPTAVEELLRFDSPVQMTSRIAVEDVDLDGTVIPQGTSIIVAIGGANRDPDVFDQPDRLWIDRPDASRHLAFSLGIHHCLGDALARLEARIAFEAIANRFPSLEMGTPTRRPLLVLRGFETIPVREGA